MTRAEVNDWADAAEVALLFADGFDDALIGIGQRFNTHFLVYDYHKVIEILTRDGLDYEEAVEHVDVNIVGAWVGEATPCFVTTRTDP